MIRVYALRCTQIMHRTQQATGFQQQIGMLSDRVYALIAGAAAADLQDFCGLFHCVRANREPHLSPHVDEMNRSQASDQHEQYALQLFST